MSREHGWEFVGWEAFYLLARNLAFQIIESSYRPDIIIAIARGGNPVANILSDYLGVKDMASIQIRHYDASQKGHDTIIEHPLTVDITGMKILLVDDVSDSGDTFEVAIAHITAANSAALLKTATLHHRSISSYRPDYYSQEVTDLRWLTYPWALMEDLGEFITHMHSAPYSLDEIAAALKRDFSVKLPQQILVDALRLVKQYR